MKLTVTECLIWVLGLLPGVSAAQTKVEISVNADYRNQAKREPIAPDFAGLSFEITSVMPGANGLPTGVHLFDPQANPQPLALFQQIGIKSLRVGAATGDGCRTPFPTHADLDPLFHFAQQADLKIIYQFRMINPASCDIPDLAQKSAETAQYLWSHYARNIAALSTSNEEDFHTAHSYCTDGSVCACIAGKGCSCLSVDPQCTLSSPGKATPALVIRDPQMYEIGISEGMTNAGSAFPRIWKSGGSTSASSQRYPGWRMFLSPVQMPSRTRWQRGSRAGSADRGLRARVGRNCWPHARRAIRRSTSWPRLAIIMWAATLHPGSTS